MDLYALEKTLKELGLTHQDVALEFGVQVKTVQGKFRGFSKFKAAEIAILENILRNGRVPEVKIKRMLRGPAVGSSSEDSLPPQEPVRKSNGYFKNYVKEREKPSELAEYLGISRQALNNKMNGSSPFSQKDIRECVKRYKMSVKDAYMSFVDDTDMEQELIIPRDAKEWKIREIRSKNKGIRQRNAIKQEKIDMVLSQLTEDELNTLFCD